MKKHLSLLFALLISACSGPATSATSSVSSEPVISSSEESTISIADTTSTSSTSVISSTSTTSSITSSSSSSSSSTISSSSSAEIINSQFMLNLVIAVAVAALIFKMPYIQLKNYYKQHLHEIDVMLPYYLKSLEILIQHYTVPVAIGKSIADAPDIFKPGLRRMIDRINSGDASVDPYMEFANTYPVRDSMRMMRLLYRLGIGSQERKQERLMMFSKTVSSLQNKARETKYKERLNHMESRTMLMLIVTGVSVMGLILITMMMMFSV